jgi:hypothetical protein
MDGTKRTLDFEAYRPKAVSREARPGRVVGLLERQGMTVRSMSVVAEPNGFIAGDRSRWAEWVRLANIAPQ